MSNDHTSFTRHIWGQLHKSRTQQNKTNSIRHHWYSLFYGTNILTAWATIVPSNKCIRWKHSIAVLYKQKMWVCECVSVHVCVMCVMCVCERVNDQMVIWVSECVSNKASDQSEWVSVLRHDNWWVSQGSTDTIHLPHLARNTKSLAILCTVCLYIVSNNYKHTLINCMYKIMSIQQD